MYDKSIFTQKTSIDRFIYAVEKGMYVEAHELLEEDWREYKTIWKKTNQEEYRLKAKAVQGLINGATALALYFIKKRPESYKKIWNVFEKYKSLLDCIEIDNIQKYYEARDLLIKINSTINLD
ncbi:MAG: hypothetical protein ACNI25_04865 [Halarcobacter sp.]